MMHPRRRFVISLAVLSAAWLGAGASRGADTAALAERGRTIYVAKGCYQCHGLVGQGSISTGPSLISEPHTAEAITAYVRAPSGVMPPYSAKLLADEEVSAIAAFLQALPKPRPAEDIPALKTYLKVRSPPPAAAKPASVAANLGHGGQLYRQYCSACHGAKLQGGVGPSLANEGATRSASQTEAFIKSPPPAMPTLYPAPLSDADIRDVSGYIHASR